MSKKRKRLTVAQVKSIRDVYFCLRVTYEELGIMFGVPSNVVEGIVNRKTWKHI